jgi:membrane-bound serine protease (ClpP class)
MLLFLLGAILLFVEVFITPGFGVMGSLGVLAVVGSLVWTLAGPGGIPVQVSWEAGYLTAALVRVFVVVILVAVLLVAALRFIPRGSGPFKRLVLSAVVDGDASAGAHDLPADAPTREALVGRRGVTDTALRPTGKMRLGDKRLEVESRGGFLEKGVTVEVESVEGRRIVVKPVKEDKA